MPVKLSYKDFEGEVKRKVAEFSADENSCDFGKVRQLWNNRLDIRSDRKPTFPDAYQY